MTDRFDNIATADLLAREAEARAEAEALHAAVRERLVAEAEARFPRPAIYKIASGKHEGRRIRLHGINAGISGWPNEWLVFGYGPLSAGKGWTIKSFQVAVERLAPDEG